jgi:aryl-alcohol dehydrogenase-like predicted oxidoreductase
MKPASHPTRRQFLQSTTLTAGALLLGRGVFAAETPPGKFDAAQRVTLGRSGLKVSLFCLGTGMRGGRRESNHTRMGLEKFTALARGAHERGVTFFDLADLYGTHDFFSRAMASVPRGDYEVVTKIWWGRGGLPEPERPDADVVVTRFLKELKTSYLDLVLLHCVTAEAWNRDLARQMELLADLKQKGVIRAHGVSCHSLPALRTAASEPWVDSIHARLNPYGASMDGKPEEILEVLRTARANGKGIVGMKIIGEGRFRDDETKKRESVKLALTCGCVDVLLVGSETLAELDEVRKFIRETGA